MWHGLGNGVEQRRPLLTVPQALKRVALGLL